MKKTLFIFTLVSLFSSSVMAFDHLHCVFDTTKTPFTLQLKFDDANNSVKLSLMAKTNKAEVVSYVANYNQQNNAYEFGANNKYSMYVDEMDSVGVDEGGPFDVSVIFGDVTMKEMTGSFHCWEMN